MREPTGREPASAKSNIFTSGIKKLIFLPRQAAPNGLSEPPWICRGLERVRVNKLSTTPLLARLWGPQLPDKQLPSLAVLCRQDSPRPCHKFFCPPACSTIIHLAVQDQTEQGFIFAGGCHLFAIFRPHTFQATSTLRFQDTFFSKGVTFRRTIHT